ncbi:MAG: hypothetical protein IV100_28925 [Myxococcales bacterium]|nr:hypothetical protein [Myxococcales bacterium]
MRSSSLVRLRATFTFVVACLWGLVASAADTRWHQVPGRPIWVDVPLPWEVAADPVRTVLEMNHPRGGEVRLVITPTDGAESTLLLESRRLESSYRSVTLTATPEATPGLGGGFDGIGFAGDTRIALRIAPTTVTIPDPTGELTLRVYLVTAASPASAKDVRALSVGLLAGARIQWERPGGAWTTVPGTTMQLQQPIAEWSAKVSADVLIMKRSSRDGEVQARFVVAGAKPDGVASSTDLDALLSRYAKGVAAPGLVPSAPAAGPKSAPKGTRVVRGEAQVEMQGTGPAPARLVVAGVPVKGGAILLIASAFGDAAPTVEALEAIALTLRATTEP